MTSNVSGRRRCFCRNVPADPAKDLVGFAEEQIGGAPIVARMAPTIPDSDITSAKG